jgi:hypothetical protein
VDKVSDTKGNYFTVAYTNDTTNGQAYPIEIDYTGNAAATPALAPYNKVQFVYAARPDITPTYHAGSLLQTTVRLTNVQTFAGANLVADYRLAYDTTITNLSSLTSVTVCAADGSCLPQTSFTATSGSGGTFNGRSFTYPNGWNFGSPPTSNWTPITGDFNGDGKTDFAFASGTVLNVSLSNGDGTFSASSFTFPNGWNFGSPPAANWTLITGDFNGDGKADFAFAGGNSIYVLLSNGDGTFSSSVSSTCGWNFAPGPNGFWWPVVGDFNGDGRTDVVFAGTQVAGLVTQTLITNVVPLFSNGDGTFTCIGTNINGAYAFGRAGNSLWMPVAGDFDGDGKTDIAFLGNTGVAVFKSNGDGTFTRGNFTYPNGWAFSFLNSLNHTKYPPSLHYSVIIGDFNADGKTDFAFGGGTTFYVFLSTGDDRTFSASAFTYPNGWNFSVPAGGYFDNRVYGTIIGDFNGDGRTDFAFSSQTVAYVFLSNGDGTFSTNAFTFPSPTTGRTQITGDFNGDGKTDFAFAGATSVDTLLVAGPPFYQLNAVTNGLGASTAFTYQPLTNGSVYIKDTTSTYPLVDLQVPIYVVSRVDTSNGIGGTYSAAYGYFGAKADLSGRGFLGFRAVQALDLQTNILATTNSRQDYPYIGLTASTEKSLGSLALNFTANTYQFSNASGAATVSTPSNASAPYQVSLAQSATASADLDGTAMPTVTTTNQYDAYGNATQVVVSTSDGFSKTTNNTYTNDTVNWFLGRLTGATVNSTTP